MPLFGGFLTLLKEGVSVESFSGKTNKLAVIGFDKYYARMLELEGIELGLDCVKIDSHYDGEAVRKAFADFDGIFAVFNSDELYSEEDSVAFLENIDAHCIRTAIVSSRRIGAYINSFVSQRTEKMCIFKRPYRIEELFLFLCGRRHSVITHLSQTHTESSKPEIKISGDTHSASFAGNMIYFTQTEFKILALLLSKRGTPVSREELYSSVWKNREKNTNTLDVYVRYIRKKFSVFFDYDIIKTVRNVGYTVTVRVMWHF